MGETPEERPPEVRGTGLRPETLGDFRILRQIGTGGMGTVYEAEQISLHRRVALKVLPAHLSFSPDAVQKFRREAEAGGRQRHPGIVAVHAVGEERGFHYIAQELVEGGRTLADRLTQLREEGEQPTGYFREATALVTTVAEALQYAHDAGVVHRDVKPSNIMLTPEGRPKVTDFGLAKVEDALALSRTGDFSGTPYYMSPEQAASQRIGIDHRTDIFSLGVTLYELITLERPFEGDTAQEVLKKILLHEPRDPRRVNPRVPRDLAVICLKAVEKRPESRYPDMRAFAADLERFRSGDVIQARPAGPARRVQKWVRRNPVTSGAAILVLLSLVGLTLYVLWSYGRILHERNRAQQAQERTEVALHHVQAAKNEIQRLLYLVFSPASVGAVAPEDRTEFRSRLNRCPPEYRRWEWNHFHLRQDLSLRQLSGHGQAATPVAVSPDRTTLASGSADQTVRLWRIEDGACLATLQGHEGNVNAVAFLPDGRLVSAGDTTVRVWDVATRQTVCTFRGHRGRVLCMAASPDGTRIASGSQENELRVWDPRTGDVVFNPGTPELNPRWITAVAFSPDGKRLAAGGCGRAWQWDVMSGGHAPSTLESANLRGMVTALAYSPDKTSIAVGTNESSAVTLWEAASGKPRAQIQGHRGEITALAYGRSGAVLASGDGQGMVRVWDAHSHRLRTVLAGHGEAITSIVFTADGQQVVTGAEDGTVRIWDVNTGGDVNTLTMPAPLARLDPGLGHEARAIPSLAFSADGTRIAAAGPHHVACLWDARTGDVVAMRYDEHPHFSAAALSPDGKLVALGCGNLDLLIWEPESGAVRTLDAGTWPQGTYRPVAIYPSFPPGITAVAFSRNGRRLASASTDACIRVFDVATGKRQMVLTGHEGMVIDVRFHPDGKRLVSAGWDETVRIWDLEKDCVVSTLRGHTRPVTSIAISPDGTQIVSGSDDKTVRIWDLESSQYMMVLRGHAGWVRSVAVSSDGRRIVSGSYDRTVRIWDLATGDRTAILKDCHQAVEVVAVSPDGKRLAAAGSGHVLVWETELTTARGLWANAAIEQEVRVLLDRLLAGTPLHAVEEKRLRQVLESGNPTSGLRTPFARELLEGMISFRAGEVERARLHLENAARQRNQAVFEENLVLHAIFTSMVHHQLGNDEQAGRFLKRANTGLTKLNLPVGDVELPVIANQAQPSPAHATLQAVRKEAANRLEKVEPPARQ